MKRIAFAFLTIVVALGLAPALHAQGGAEVGAFGDYYRLSSTDTSFGGVGARLGAGAKWLHLEAEASYDFEQFFTEGFTNPSTGAISFTRTGVRLFRADVGPKFQMPGPVKFFVTVKGGIDDFDFSNAPATFATVGHTLAGLTAANVDPDLYAGGGFEGFLGPVGLRLDIGDDIFFTGPTHGNNNLRVSFGPQFRF